MQKFTSVTAYAYGVLEISMVTCCSVRLYWLCIRGDGRDPPDHIPYGIFTLHELDNLHILRQLQGAHEDGDALAWIEDMEGVERWSAKGVTDDMFGH